MATDGTSGTILSGTIITKNYDIAANYVLNGATVNPFPAAINTTANLTIGANVSLNKNIDVNSILNLASFVLTQNKNDLEFSGLTSTTGSISADKMSILTINGTVDTVRTLRFTAGGNTTGQFTINRPITVPLGSDLIIDNAPKSGNFITGTATSILDINGNTLTINGAVSGIGFLSGSNTSNLTLGGTATTVNFLTGKQILKNLTMVNNASALLGTPLDITGGTGPGTEGTVSITLAAKLTTNGNLTLKSNLNGTSRIATGAVGGGYIIGDVTVERYLPSIRAWRFMAAPTVGQTIKQSWQENQPAGVNPGTGFGTMITSNNGSFAANGFDFQTNGNSLLIYNPTTNVWDGALNTTSQIAIAGGNKSYMLFSRGDRSVTPNPGAAPTPVLLRSKGQVFQGNLPLVPVNAGQFASVGNNYAAAIDFTALGFNIDQSFSVWDPKIPGQKGFGGWITFSSVNSWNPTPVVPGGTYTAANKRIESGQAFMVHNSSGSAGNVTINESSKISGSKLVSRPSGSNSVKQILTTNLYNTNGGAANIADGNVVVFYDGYSNAIDDLDAVKMNNFGDNFGLSRDGKTLIVEARQPVTNTDTVFFNMKKIKQQTYRLEFIATNFDANLVGFLEDNYLHSTTVVNMNGTTTADFSVTGDAASAAADRFRIVFTNLAPLPVTFTNVTAAKKSNGIAVAWNVENEINISSYEVEHSADGTNFTKATITAATGQNSGGTALYNWLDVQAAAGDNYYRIKSISNRGTFGYSRIVKVAAAKGNEGFTVYPNPVTDGIIGFRINSLPAGVYTTRLINNAGQMLSKNVLTHVGGTATKTIIPSSTLISGTYQLEVTGPDNKITIIKVLVQAN